MRVGLTQVPCTRLLKNVLIRSIVYVWQYSHVHEGDTRASRELVPEGGPEAWSGSGRIVVFAEEPVHPQELSSMRPWRGPRQLCLVWTAQGKAVFDLRAERPCARGFGGDRERPA